MDQPTIVFTDAAAKRVTGLVNGDPGKMLRVFVSGGGCSGFEYGFSFEDVSSDDDTKFVVGGVTFLVDPMSYQYLVGATIDYVDDLSGAHFTITNPNAKSTCGCGSSFTA